MPRRPCAACGRSCAKGGQRLLRCSTSSLGRTRRSSSRWPPTSAIFMTIRRGCHSCASRSPKASYLKGGGHYIRGGSKALSDRLVELITEADGVVETGRDVFALIFGG